MKRIESKLKQALNNFHLNMVTKSTNQNYLMHLSLIQFVSFYFALIKNLFPKLSFIQSTYSIYLLLSMQSLKIFHFTY